MKVWELETERLRLRQWKKSDLAVFAEMNSDPWVMKHFPTLLTPSESNIWAEQCALLIAERGWGLWAAALKECGSFAGFIGLTVPKAKLPFSPCVEIGWRLHRRYWGRGFATEGATEALQFAFNVLTLDDVVSFTTLANRRSRAVMARLGMSDTHSNFIHPALEPRDPLAEHVLYKITRYEWHKRASQLRPPVAKGPMSDPSA